MLSQIFYMTRISPLRVYSYDEVALLFWLLTEEENFFECKDD